MLIYLVSDIFNNFQLIILSITIQISSIHVQGEILNIFGWQINRVRARWIALQILILIDVILILMSIFYELPADFESYFHIFDFCLCIILLLEWGYRFYISRPKKIFLKQRSNIIDLIASIPFDVILPLLIPQAALLKYLKVLRLLRVFALVERFFHGVHRFLDRSYLDKILCGVFAIIFIFTVLMYYYGPSYGLFDDFYFVVVTLTTVGYGDVTPHTASEKIITVFLIIIGVFVFSTITAGISSYLTDRLLDDEEEDISNIVAENVKPITSELAEIRHELEVAHNENQELKDEIRELKELIKGD